VGILEKGHFTLHYYSSGSVFIDILVFVEDSRQVLEKIEEHFGDIWGWENCTGSIILDRGAAPQTLLNNYYHSATLYKNMQLLHREKSQYQDIRVYESQEMGKVLSLDSMIQITELEEDNYTVDLCKLVIENKTRYDHILLIGAGDMIIPKYILQNKDFNVGKVTVVEIDDRVYENTKKYFKGFEEVEIAIGRETGSDIR